jgi:hypothetical protein
MLRLESIAHNLGMMKISNMAIMLDLVKSRKKKYLIRWEKTMALTR